MNVRFKVNGHEVACDVPPMKRLLDVLRLDAGLTGTKEGCGEGECGACTVLIDGELANSCLVPACHADGASITTVEGMTGGDRELTPLQRAFVDVGGTQCGICTPGMLLAAQVYLDRNEHVTPAGVREALAGNLCRCTGYQKIIDAVVAAAHEAARARREGKAA